LIYNDCFCPVLKGVCIEQKFQSDL